MKICLVSKNTIRGAWTQACDCKRDGCEFYSHLVGMKYFNFHEVKGDIGFGCSTHNAFSIGRKLGTDALTLGFQVPSAHCYVRDEDTAALRHSPVSA